MTRAKRKSPQTKKAGCQYPKNCGWVEEAVGCQNLACGFMSRAALVTNPFFADGNPFTARRKV